MLLGDRMGNEVCGPQICGRFALPTQHAHLTSLPPSPLHLLCRFAYPPFAHPPDMPLGWTGANKDSDEAQSLERAKHARDFSVTVIAGLAFSASALTLSLLPVPALCRLVSH